ncbi:MAG TPA: hypothetical protein PKH39_18105 [Woeseiaceae bacterium]|nr:hypothetical protein [Woeseiaceae bacterium]
MNKLTSPAESLVNCGPRKMHLIRIFLRVAMHFAADYRIFDDILAQQEPKDSGSTT